MSITNRSEQTHLLSHFLQLKEDPLNRLVMRGEDTHTMHKTTRMETRTGANRCRRVWGLGVGMRSPENTRFSGSSLMSMDRMKWWSSVNVMSTWYVSKEKEVI